MRGLPALEPAASARARRWDVVILGGAIPGLVCAAVLAKRGASVLVLEEAAATKRFPGLREPFLICGAGRESVLGACLAALDVPLLEQRCIEREPIAFQAVLRDARVDVGEPGLTADEWVAWGLAKPEMARSLVRAIAHAAAGEREAMLAGGPLRAERVSPRGMRRGAAPGHPEASGQRHARGLPAEAAEVPPRLAALLAAQTRALSNLAAAQPSVEARARLLGSPLEGAAEIRGETPWLRDILRRRIRSLYGEFRTVPEPFRLVTAGGRPGVAPAASGAAAPVCVGRAFVLNAARSALARVVEQDPVPEQLAGPPLARRRLALHFRVDRGVLPEGMARRVLLVRDATAQVATANPVSLRIFPGAAHDAPVDLVAAVVVDGGETELGAREAEIEAAVAELIPFAGSQLVRVPSTPTRWDDESLLVDPAGGAGWPGECNVRIAGKQPLYHLDRGAMAGLGFEGDILLGWRAGDVIAADLS
jgi:hypothetical protein